MSTLSSHSDASFSVGPSDTASALPTASPVPVVAGVSSSSEAQLSLSTPQSNADADIPRRVLPKRSEVWGVPFDHVRLPEAVEQIEQLVQIGKPSYVITANLNYVMLHHDDQRMLPVTEDANLILADGQPIVWRSMLDRTALPERVAGSEMIYRLAESAARNGYGIYFLGGKPGVAAACAEELTRQFPGLIVSGVESPPFRELTQQEQAEQYQRIRDSGAGVLLVAFGQPKGEKWIHQHYQQLGVPVSIQLGASFDFIAGTARRAPKIWQRFGLEWAYRMMSDPMRLAPRYAANFKFLAAVLIKDWKVLVRSWGLLDDEPKGALGGGYRRSRS